MKRAWRCIHHTPVWRPTRLPVDAAGNTRPGFVCVHLLENGNGQCGGNVFTLAEAFGDHSCIVHRARGPRSRMHSAYRRRRRR